jgi:hypothetical protein
LQPVAKTCNLKALGVADIASMPVRANFDRRLYFSPMRGLVKVDNFCDMLQTFATFSRAIEVSKVPRL